MDSYEPWHTGKRGHAYNDVVNDLPSGVLGLLVNVGANLAHNAKEITNVTLFFRKLGSHDPPPSQLQVKLLRAHGLETSSSLIAKATEFMQGKNIVSVTVDSYMPTSMSGSAQEESYAVVMYR